MFPSFHKLHQTVEMQQETQKQFQFTYDWKLSHFPICKDTLEYFVSSSNQYIAIFSSATWIGLVTKTLWNWIICLDCCLKYGYELQVDEWSAFEITSIWRVEPNHWWKVEGCRHRYRITRSFCTGRNFPLSFISQPHCYYKIFLNHLCGDLTTRFWRIFLNNLSRMAVA